MKELPGCGEGGKRAVRYELHRSKVCWAGGPNRQEGF